MTTTVWNQVSGNFQDKLFEMLLLIEAPNKYKRLNLHAVNSNPTIGVGFDLKAGDKVIHSK